LTGRMRSRQRAAPRRKPTRWIAVASRRSPVGAPDVVVHCAKSIRDMHHFAVALLPRRRAASSFASCATMSQRSAADARAIASARASSALDCVHSTFGPTSSNSRVLTSTRDESVVREST
jgi:hypothetical protein